MQRQEERKVAFFTQLFLDTPYMECSSRWNHKCQTCPQAEKKRVSPSLVPRPVLAIRAIRGYIYIYISLTGDVTSEIAEVDWERGWVLPTTALLGNTRQPWGPGKHNNFFNYFTSFAASGRSFQSD